MGWTLKSETEVLDPTICPASYCTARYASSSPQRTTAPLQNLIVFYLQGAEPGGQAEPGRSGPRCDRQLLYLLLLSFSTRLHQVRVLAHIVHYVHTSISGISSSKLSKLWIPMDTVILYFSYCSFSLSIPHFFFFLVSYIMQKTMGSFRILLIWAIIGKYKLPKNELPNQLIF